MLLKTVSRFAKALLQAVRRLLVRRLLVQRWVVRRWLGEADSAAASALGHLALPVSPHAMTELPGAAYSMASALGHQADRTLRTVLSNLLNHRALFEGTALIRANRAERSGLGPTPQCALLRGKLLAVGRASLTLA